ncbi:FixH family protein [Planctomycetes bacterium K23_9]|uniref:FixH n=1 Tax=Stieleria marina TaxID=1930275 RepID=A0A517NR06_9BACT|nr:FixH [Planctomycetes bacterium K23_9]
MTTNDSFYQLDPAVQRSAERRAKYFWVSLVVTLLGIQLVIGFFSIHLATSDPTVSVIPEYHKTALNWDQQKYVSTAADRLGWEIDLVASDVADGQGRRAVEIAVRDENGKTIDNLSLHATAYHHAAATDIRKFSVDSVGNGNYMTLAPLGRSGIWNLEIDIAGADEPITLRRTIEVIQ